MGEIEITQDAFEKFFSDFDTDKNGIITKNEMRVFIKQVLLQS